ncbi:hypothetical protein V5799_000795 [Amblyomma americanum]|uniref:Uncharacterized protein n=1 Tax=Amblyomma americanum TaxID=6943 RepID=A0AAQ4D212_AMBAM
MDTSLISTGRIVTWAVQCIKGGTCQDPTRKQAPPHRQRRRPLRLCRFPSSSRRNIRFLGIPKILKGWLRCTHGSTNPPSHSLQAGDGAESRKRPPATKPWRESRWLRPRRAPPVPCWLKSMEAVPCSVESLLPLRLAGLPARGESCVSLPIAGMARGA